MPTVAELEKRLDRQDERLDAFESSQSGMNEKMIRLDEKMNNSNNEMKRMNDKLTEVSTDVKTLIMKPARSWDSTKAVAISVVLGLVIGFLFDHFIT